METLTVRLWRNRANPALQCVLLFLLFGLPLNTVEAGTKDSALGRLALTLVDGPAPLRADLAQAALLELSADYAREANRARDDLRRKSNNKDLRRWVGAIDRLAAEQAALAASVTPTTPVEITLGPDHDLHLSVAGKPIVVAGPRPREQAALERRILERYCQLNLCDPEAYTAPSRSEESDSVMQSSATLRFETDAADTAWSFSPAGPSCSTRDGLEFQFSTTDALRQKRRLCALLSVELHRLAAAIDQQLKTGTSIDWNAMRIDSQPNTQLQRVVLTRGGADIELQLPTLNALPELFELVRPWLAAKVHGESYHLVVINAERHMAALLLMPES